MSVILPGSYDPVTLGHLDIIRQAAAEYREVYAVVFVNPEKEYTFSLEDRVKMLILATDDLPNVIVSYSNGYVVDYMREHGISEIMKGYRNDTDLQYENKQAEYNLTHGGYRTLLRKAAPELAHISSTLARGRIAEGGDLTGILPEAVIAYLESKKV